MKWQSMVYWNEKMFGTSKLITANAVYTTLHIFITQHKEENTVDQFLLTSLKSIYNRRLIEMDILLTDTVPVR